MAQHNQVRCYASDGSTACSFEYVEAIGDGSSYVVKRSIKCVVHSDDVDPRPGDAIDQADDARWADIMWDARSEHP